MKKQILTNQKGNRGITLIALVITIIVLLILAGISIATLTGENGILTRASDAKIETRGASVQEARDLWKINQEADKQTENETAQTLEALLNDLESQKLITTEERATIKKTGEVTIGSRTIVFKEKKLTDYVKIGDYVDYHPDEVTTPYDKFGEPYTGYANINIGQDSTLEWQVLNINSDGTIDLISNKSTSQAVFFKGARGYNNGVAILNDYCKTMYSNISKGAVARSLNIEDIQDKMKVVDEETGEKEYEKYESLYKKSYSYSNSKWYPLKWKEDMEEGSGSGLSPEFSASIVSYSSDDEAKGYETSGPLTVLHNSWISNGKFSIGSSFVSADTRDPIDSDSMYYRILINNGGDLNYWLASRCVSIENPEFAYYKFHVVGSNGVGGVAIDRSRYDNVDGGRIPVRPIVSLQASAIDLNTNYEIVGKWNLNS